jgi:hypothetical protein
MLDKFRFTFFFLILMFSYSNFIIEPLSAGGERELIECLMTEIADRHAIAVNTEPHLDHCSGDNIFSDDIDNGKNPRLFAIGALHVTRIIGGLAECGLDIVNLAKLGWLLNETSAAEIKKNFSISILAQMISC